MTEKKKPGRKRKEVNTEQLERLAEIHCTLPEIEKILGVSHMTIKRHFRDVLERGRAKGRESLRRAQWHAAEQGNVSMLIWLGKQILKQRDRREVTGELTQHHQGAVQIDRVELQERIASRLFAGAGSTTNTSAPEETKH